MTPYKQVNHLTRVQQRHNYCLSSDRICIEHAFGILKGRWRRLHFINTYSTAKAIEIATAACILHNFCYFHHDEWNGDVFTDNNNQFPIQRGNIDHEPQFLGRLKRDNIAATFV